MNEEVFKKMDQSGRDDDKPWRLINHTITRSAQPLVSAWAEIIRVESVVKDDKSSPDSSDPEVILTLPDGSSLNVSQIRIWMDLTLQTLGIANAQIITQCKHVMKPALSTQNQELCDKGREFTYKIFGDDLKGQMDDINKLSKLGTQITKPKHKSPAASTWWKTRNASAPSSQSHFLSPTSRFRQDNR